MSSDPHHHARPERPTRDVRADRLGIGGSALCLVHCTGTGALAGLGSAAGRLAGLAEAWLHPLLALALVPAALVALRGGDPGARSLLGVGAALVVAALVAGHGAGHGTETGLTVAGSLLLLAGHRRNRLGPPSPPPPDTASDRARPGP